MVKHAHEQNQVELFFQLAYIVNGHFPKLDVASGNFSRKARLGKIVFVEIDSKDTAGPSALHLNRVKSGIAADIENGFSAQIRWNGMFEGAPLNGRIIAQKMCGSGVHSV